MGGGGGRGGMGGKAEAVEGLEKIRKTVSGGGGNVRCLATLQANSVRSLTTTGEGRTTTGVGK